jgi:glycine reductase
MSLVFRRFKVRDVTLGSQHSFDDRVLTIAGSELGGSLCSQDQRIKSVTMHVARPGDATRILCTKDVVQPRYKLGATQAGMGTTVVLENIAVVTCGPIVAFQEGIIDMSGVGASYTPFSSLTLVVLELDVVDGTEAHEHEAAIRFAGLHVAETLAKICVDHVADRSEQLFWNEKPIKSGLPRIVYVDMVLSQGLLHDTYVLGRNATEGLPCFVDPRLAIDGGVVSGNCVSACDKTTTFHHQNNPLVVKLLEGHGDRWDFAGVVITNEPTRLAEKERSAQRTVELVRALNVDGAVISKEGFGNPDADLMMIVRGLESAGIQSVAITDEFAGRDGDSQSLADTTSEADAVVSVGNANQRLELPPMQKVIGPLPDVTRLAGGYAHSLREDGSMEVELQALVGSTNQLGFGSLSCREI